MRKIALTMFSLEKVVSFKLENSARADPLVTALEDVGAIVKVESEQDALRVVANGEA